MPPSAKSGENYGFLRMASAVPPLRVGDVDYNVGKILEFTKNAASAGAKITLFPEMSLSGYTLADLFFQRILLDNVQKGLEKIRDFSKGIKSIIMVGLPLEYEGKLLNAAAVIFGGEIYGIIPKTHIPGYKEFYEERWFASSRDVAGKEIKIGKKIVPLGTDILFRLPHLPGAVLGVEICEDLWVPIPPSSGQVLAGATIIFNLSTSNDLVGKADYRRSLVQQQSAKGICGYIYSSSGAGESTTDLVFGGHAIIAENGIVLEESKRFQREGELIISEIDMEHILSDRERMTSFGEIKGTPSHPFRVVDIPLKVAPSRRFYRAIDPRPFVPPSVTERDLRAKEIFSIQIAGLTKRLEASRIDRMIIGLSGGLDSTLAFLVAVKTADALGLSYKNIHALVMPGFGTSERTHRNAICLAKAWGVGWEEISIKKGTLQQFSDIGHNPKVENRVYENVQARYRTLTLMDKANQIKGLVIGTGDLSEIALGWNTYIGDHIAHYNVNCGVPKTLVKYLVEWVAETQRDKKMRRILEDILATPISPELKKSKKEEISQKTEEIIGPYELHDFFLYHFLRWGSSPRKILFLAKRAWGGKYSEAALKKWLRVFLTRFFGSQWKRSVATDGPKVGSVSLSPRGDWRMPSDADVKTWLDSIP